MSTELPRPIGRTDAAFADPETAGAAWRLAEPTRGLDANVIVLPSGATIDRHEGPGLDVLVTVLAGAGIVETAESPFAVTAGDLVWLPGDAVRGFRAGDGGLRYLTVHTRKPGLQIGRADALGERVPSSEPSRGSAS